MTDIILNLKGIVCKMHSDATEVEAPRLRACCRTDEGGEHVPTCASLDAQQRRAAR